MKKFILALGLGTLIMFYVFNLGHAVNDYGIVENSMTLSVLAQSGSTGDDSGSDSSGGGSTSDEGSTTDDNPAPTGYNAGCWKLPNNHNGGNQWLYTATEQIAEKNAI